jgi:hypothetical protein
MIEDWHRRRLDEVQTAFDVVREYLEQRPRDEWRRPDFDLLSGKLRLLGERHFVLQTSAEGVVRVTCGCPATIH